MLAKLVWLATGLCVVLACGPPSAEAETSSLPGRGFAAPTESRLEAGRVTRIGVAIERAAGTDLDLRIRNTSAVGAYAWPSGRIVVTRGLLEALDDEEVAAALAHEVGHLLADGHLHDLAGEQSGARSLRGAYVGGRSGEARADRIGVRLLARAGIAPEAMARMLHRVRERSRSGSLRAALSERIALLAGP